MDDLGAEFLSELSTSCVGGVSVSVPVPVVSTHPPKITMKDPHSQLETITPVLEDLSLDSSDEGKEKADVTPENIKKIDDVIILPNVNKVIAATAAPPTTTAGVSTIDESSSISISSQKSPMAFTIDFGGTANDNLTEQQQAKYKNMVERFQNRHRRGASMSKLESSGESSQAVVSSPSQPTTTTTAAKVKMRIRDRSTSGVRGESSNRHSWSPRSSTHEPPHPTPAPRTNAKNTVAIQQKKPLPPRRKKEAFTPKSLAMQKAMEKFEMYLPEPPLISNGKSLAEPDVLSEAGTYTLDGDNYTEEQKELMNIDDEHLKESISIEEYIKQSGIRKSKVLEVSYFQDSTNVIPEKKHSKTSYLEKIKTRVRANFKSSSPDKDCGTFTSITTSGVLAKRSVLNSAPAVSRRKHSLSKSQIDSSEYISREKGLTDLQKSEYRLNVFTNQTDSQLLSSLESDVASLKTAQTKNDWIQEWARNARARSIATDTSCNYSNDYDYSNSDPNLAKLMSPKPPKSPTKIPSPMHTTRLAIRTRASLQNLIGIELSDSEDPNLYLEKTKMLINNLQENLSRRNSLKSSNTSPKKSAHTTSGINLEHKRNLSLDYHIPSRNQSLQPISPRTSRPIPKQSRYTIDQTTSPLKRSSSFSVKPLSASSSSMVTPNGRRTYKPQAPAPIRRGVPLQKSASSNSFRKMYSDYDDNVEYYINDEDDLIDNDYYSSDEEEFEATSGDYYDDEEIERSETERPSAANNLPRYNKALLMRIERNKQKGQQQQQPAPTSAPLGGCRNTPEMPRRNVNSAGIRSSMRQSMPRDTSLNRLKNEPSCVPSSLASAKKQLLQSANNNARVQPKYMDISKYKPAQSANFLRRNESKLTLKPEIKRSPSNVSSTTVNSGFSRGDSARVSNRSVKSLAGYKPSLQGNTNRIRDSSVSKQKEAELEMWKRRAKYDPMKAAAEDKKKKEEAKRIAQSKSSTERISRSPNRRC